MISTKRTKNESTVQRITPRKERKRTGKIKGMNVTRKQESLKFLVKVRRFSGAKVSYIVHYVKPTIRNDKLDNVILYTETNYLGSEKAASQIARSITELAMSLKDNDNSVIVSGIVPRHDNLYNKATKINNRLLLMCKERNIRFTSHSEIIDSSKQKIC